MTILVVAIVVLFALAAVVVLATGRRRAATGRLSRETVSRDEAARATDPGVELATAEEESEKARRRAAEARESIDSDVPAQRESAEVAELQPIDEAELGVTRRQFFNRGILAGIGASIGAFGVAALGFVWPSGAGGFGGAITIGSVDQANASFGKKEPLYNAGAKTYIVQYPSDALENAEAAYADQPPVLAGMQEGYVALYQRCVHLGCRVPWCQTSQWFECPCHGSKYSRVGEKKGGPAPRGLDRFGVSIEGGSIVVDTAVIWTGPAIGTDTTGQGQEGAPCV